MPSNTEIIKLTDADIQRDFIELWMSIEDSINRYELAQGMLHIKYESDKKSTIINLNLEL